MTPDERLTEEASALSKAEHDQLKSDHYAHLGKAFVVRDVGQRPASGGGRGAGGRGGRGANRGSPRVGK
jgi:hypothetical protein